MAKVFAFSLLLVAGLVGSQLVPFLSPALFSFVSQGATVLTLIGLSFIMIRVGYEFEIDKTRAKTYGVDYLVADNIRGPWTEVGKRRGPQIVRSIPGKVFGPGHNSIVSSPDGKRDFLVYHAWNAARTDRQVWVDPIVWTLEGPRVERFRERIAEMNRAAGRTR